MAVWGVEEWVGGGVKRILIRNTFKRKEGASHNTPHATTRLQNGSRSTTRHLLADGIEQLLNTTFLIVCKN